MVPVNHINMVRAFFLIPQTFHSLRHDIEHSAWTPGPTSGSIIPGLTRQRPLLDTKAEEQWIKDFERCGHMEDRGYDLESLCEFADSLDHNCKAFEKYARKVGLIKRQGDTPQ